MRRRLRRSLPLGAFLICLLPAGRVHAGIPLHAVIDREIEAKLNGQVAAPATDAEFLRRIYLDLTGIVPTSGEARAFLDDPSPYKRDRLIDRLLAGPQYPRRMEYVFDTMLMERRPDQNVPTPEWRAYLRKSFAENKPYDKLVAEILSADGSDPAHRAPSKFYLDRGGEPYLITRDVGRLFLGVDMQCAQCHDHPLVDDYKQAHYYGLHAFFSRSSLFTDPASKVVSLAEKAEGEVTFVSVFKKKVTNKTGPRLFDLPPVAEPTVPKGWEYLVAPNKDNTVRTVPRYSRLEQLAPRLTAKDVPAFRRNIANRLWAMMMGRGLVHPVDLHHGDNPPSHPALLDRLADELAAMHYDVKAFLRELALTRVYQRSTEPPPGASAEWNDPARYAVAALKPQSAEQLGWSVMQGLGFVADARARAEHAVDVADPKLRDILRTDAKRQRLRGEMIEASIDQQLAGNLGAFVNQFALAPGQSQDGAQPTVHQALFLANGYPIQGWLAPSGSNLVARLSKLADASSMAEELYLSLYARRPAEEERAEVARYLEKRGKDQRVQALQELAWALLASTEFRFNH